MPEQVKIAEITHPKYDELVDAWEKFRLTFKGGEDFVEAYLAKLSIRENTLDYNTRLSLSYAPAHAKAAIIDVKNSIYQRLSDITRDGGVASYVEAVAGNNGGVDLNGATMTGYVGRMILPDLLSIGKIGVFIDKPPLDSENPAFTMADSKKIRPYLYTYAAEDIRSWAYGPDNQLSSVLLRREEDVIDEETGLVTDTVETFLLLRRNATGTVDAVTYDADGNETGSIPLLISQIPFVIFELSSSLLTDVADYQIALLNLASTDMVYALQSNFPFYTEEYDPIADMFGMRNTPPSVEGDLTGDKTGETSEMAATHNPEIAVGVAKGRRYPKGSQRPGFIAPPTDPLRASMEKQKNLQAEIRMLVNLAIQNLAPTRESAESKQMDQTGLEAGLSYIGLELAEGETKIAQIWSEYEGRRNDTVSVKYPRQYSLKTDEDRRKEAKEMGELLPTLPSLTYQRETAKQIIAIIHGPKVRDDVLKQMFAEIDAAKVIAVNPEVLRQDHEAGFVSTETASLARGYPQGEVEQAKKDHAERLARIQEAQTSDDASARGIPDAGANPDAGSQEKTVSRDTDSNDTTKDTSRGEGK